MKNSKSIEKNSQFFSENNILNFNLVQFNLIHHTISPKRGRPQKIDSSIIDGVIVSAKSYPTQHLSQIAGDFDLSKSSVKTILNDRNIKYFEKTPVTPLTTVH